MAPEQALGALDHVDERSDVYSLGSILHTILYGRPPVTGESRDEIVMKVARGELQVLEDEVAGRVPRELAAVVERALRFQPEDRYASAGALRDDIEAFLEGRTLSVVTYGPWALVRKWARRNRRLCAVAASLVLISGILFGGYLWKVEAQRTARFRGHLEAARAQLDPFDLQALDTLQKKRPLLEPGTGREYEESGAARDRRREAIRAHLAAANALDRALQIRPGHADAVSLRIEIGERVGRIALGGAEYLLARQAIVDLAPLGVEKKGWAKEVDTARRSRQLWRKDRIGAILVDIGLGLSRKRPVGAPGIDEYIQENLSYRDRQTVELLGEALEDLMQKVEPVAGGGEVVWTRPERDTAHYVSQVLGGLGWVECIAPLGKWVNAIRDPSLIQEAALALCRTRHPSAREPLHRLRDRIGSNDPSWVRIQRVLGQIPGSEEEEGAVGVQRLRARALARKHRGDLQGALGDYDLALQIDPAHVTTRINRALIHMAMGDDTAARADLDESLRREPRYRPP
jgi:tetratricopeptide (TPR) repeat protein